MSTRAEQVRAWLLDLQDRIIAGLETADGSPFLTDGWVRGPEERLQGDGRTRLIEEGKLFERGGCNFSHVRGDRLPPSASAHRADLAGASFEAMGVSLVLHPRNPYVPTVHLNVRFFTAQPQDGDAVWWFGGGMDLTPYYGFEEDAAHFHRTCRDALAPYGTDTWARYKQWCDEYFHLKHRNEPRGVGGIFYDYLASDKGWAADFAFTQDVGRAFLEVYPTLVLDHMHTPWTPEQRQHQLVRRGRYVEFNLLYDRGTRFGLQTGGNPAAILMSMPPEVHFPAELTSAA